jgi:IclR family transcriptional regulator, acetate operon repressor
VVGVSTGEPDKKNGGVRSVLNALRILEEVSRQQPIGVSELARVLELPKTSVDRSLRTLHLAGWVRTLGTETTRWGLTTKALTVGLAGSRETSLRELAVAEMDKIRDATGETVHLVVPEEDELVVIARLDGTRSLRTFLPLGARAPLHATASGRAMLASMHDDDVDAILDHGIHRYTKRTLLDRERVWREIKLVRRRGFGTNAAEWRTDIAAIGASIGTVGGSPLAAFAISMPLSRYQAANRSRIAKLVIEAADRVSRELREHQLSG